MSVQTIKQIVAMLHGRSKEKRLLFNCHAMPVQITKQDVTVLHGNRKEKGLLLMSNTGIQAGQKSRTMMTKLIQCRVVQVAGVSTTA